LLADAEANELGARFETLRSWYMKERGNLVVDGKSYRLKLGDKKPERPAGGKPKWGDVPAGGLPLPDVPFDDWTGVAPPDPRLILQLP
jgi:hypothetical protein